MWVIKNLISVCQFTRDNNCTIEFDSFGFSVKDFLTRHILFRCDSSGDLYPVTKPSTLPAAFLSTSSTTWHQCLGHPEDEVLHSLSSRQLISCNKAKSTHVCHACQLGKHVKLPFHSSNSLVKQSFDIIHSDLWTSPIWPIHQLDVKNAFLNADLSETVYMHQPLGFVDSRYPNHVCLLHRSLYGLKQAPRAWSWRFVGYATRAGFSLSRCDSSLFIYTQGSHVAYLLIYVDDIILTTSSPVLLQQIIDSLHKEFDMTDLGALNYFLGTSVVHHPTGLFLSQKKYALQLLERGHMVNCNPSGTPVDTDSKLGPDGVPGTLELGLHLYASATTSLVGYTDADWAGCPSTCRNCIANPVHHQRTKHIEIDIHFVRDMVKASHVRVLHVPPRFQYADIFTKGLPSALFEDFHSSLSVRPPPA
ncbi:ribonuclease H-like domain-containing protein [Tanacetum coccineum]